MLETIIIPETITVHLGTPSSNAENVKVSFRDYCKNVASSEIYPNWPYEALKANILAQMSLVLNRIYTEWYPTLGYDFDITNSTAYDQAFVKGRNIFESVAMIVDEVIGNYLQYPFYREPFYSEYCDGKKAQCPGMKQWGTLDLANRGFNALEILRYYYGDTLQLKYTNNIQVIPDSYPGYPIREGNTSEYVFIIQELLNGIAVNFPNIPLIYPPNSIFDDTTKQAVIIFQRQFNLTADGIVGRATWNQLSRAYVAVRKLAQLKSLGRLEGYFSGLWVNRILKRGVNGILVQQLQYFLSIISQYNDNIPDVTIDGRFGQSTYNVVLAFQKNYGLLPDGIVGVATWKAIVNAFKSISNELRSS